MTLNIVVDELLQGAENAEGTAVIVDIFRATSLLSTLFHLGAKEIYPTQNIEEAEKLKEILEKKGKNILIGGETEGKTPEDFNFSNSPLEVYDSNYSHKIKDNSVVYTSTNGVRGILSAKKSNEIITASFLNYKAVADYLNKTKPKKITIIGMGEFGKSAPEDRLFSYFLKDILTDQKPGDLEEIRKSIYEGESAKWMIKKHGEEINKDLEFCLNTDLNFNVVPKLYGDRILDVLK